MLRPTPGDPREAEQHHWNTGAKENQQLNPGGPSNRQKLHRLIYWDWTIKCRLRLLSVYLYGKSKLSFTNSDDAEFIAVFSCKQTEDNVLVCAYTLDTYYTCTLIVYCMLHGHSMKLSLWWRKKRDLSNAIFNIYRLTLSNQNYSDCARFQLVHAPPTPSYLFQTLLRRCFCCRFLSPSFCVL